MSNHKLLGVRMAELRKKRNMTQYQLAAELKKSTSTIAMWETGNRDPDSEMISEIASYFNVSSDYLLGRTDIPDAISNSEDNLSSVDEDVRALAREIQDLNSGDKDLLKAMIRTMRERGKEARERE